MLGSLQPGTLASQTAGACAPRPRTTVFWLQSVTVIWMLAELAVSAYAAVSSHSAAMFAFGSDSLVDLLSAVVVLLQWVPNLSVAERSAARAAGALLFVLAFAVTVIALASLVLKTRPGTSCAGIGITAAALVVMPVLAALKRAEARRSGNAALAADAVQSAACAYLALIALAGLAANAAFHIPWFDSAAALAAVPLLLREGRTAWRGHACHCC